MVERRRENEGKNIESEEGTDRSPGRKRMKLMIPSED
jgi:hypothetical protein